ncbi:ABC transporter B family member 21-like [Phalaenopsis equestris]|uniref:ABC transporter B family member 21-like n=1 Tax=Phalaenopsis equestris TaxID=78828 RepID=UPI0009E49D14|nr:ABC transporter B family member 21-like [Phalaenopsis equestris]XP_020573476.1 ABC transporter B family member 21-like [Phalaenopsis equestris]XP_020573478.1 ABC transporter B family member 21-like [Phalaenopsis equestris]XP_020573479.1 ABC transporter B family member 21-like [Phalaenopsis equestris]
MESSNEHMLKEEKKTETKQDHKSEQNDEGNNMAPFYKLFSYADSMDIALMIIGTAGAVANGLVLPLTTLFFGNLINSFGRTVDIQNVLHEVSKETLKFVYLALGAGIASFLQASCWMHTGERQAERLRKVYLKAILRQEIAFFDKEINTGEIVGRISGDSIIIQDAMGEKVGQFIQLISTFFGGFTVAFVQGWLLTLAMLSTIPPLVFAGAIISKVMAKMASQGQTAYAAAADLVEQTINSIRIVASFTGEKQAVDKYCQSLKLSYHSSVKEGLVAGIGLGTAMLLFFCGYALGIWYGCKLILEKGYTGGDVFNVIFAVLTSSLSLGQASPCLSSFVGGQAAAFKMFETIERKPEIDAENTEGRTPEDIHGNIEFKNVCFSYPARPSEHIFKDLSLVIKSGTTVALVGESGSGKSTVISLIERFYDPQDGEVLIDNINLKEFQLKWIRRKISLVSQEPVLFTCSIRDNITYGKEDATIEEIKSAVELSNASSFINKLPQGFDTMVGEYGTQLSGGQKQRLAIARAILKDPRILLLDEATSALDAESEQLVLKSLEKVMHARTTIIVAHRMSTVTNSDTIVVLQKGSIVQKGSHRELLKNKGGAYSQLLHLQEMKQDSEQDRVVSLAESGRQASQRNNFPRSISRGRSVGPRHSFSVPFVLPLGLEIQDNSMEPDMPEASSSSQHKSQDLPLLRLAYLNKPELPIFILGVIAAIFNGIILPIFGVLLSNMIETFYQPPNKLKKDSRFYAIMFIVLGLLSLLAMPARSYFFAIAGSRLISRIRVMTFEKIVNMEIEWFDDSENSSGAVEARLSVDAAAFRSLVGDNLALLVQNTATLSIGLAIAFAANWQLSFIILGLIPLIGLNSWAQIVFMKGFTVDAKIIYEKASQVASDAVGNIRTVASFTAEEKVVELYKERSKSPKRTGIRQAVINGTGIGLSFFLLFCVYAASFYAGARLVQDGKTTFGKVFRVFFALAMAAIGVSHSSNVAPDSNKARCAVASVLAILDRKSKIDASDDSGTKLEELRGNIEFQQVRFSYPTRKEVQVLQNLTLSIKSGKTIALVGESGCGKSTIISLLQRFYDPDSGQILLDGININRFQIKWLRQQMGLVSQEPSLFNDTIRANIAYGKEGKATEAEIVAASESANSHNFICALQQGYDTVVGERGGQLSGGQKQRVAIARSIVKEPKILLFDEATSALDAESELVVQEALNQVKVNRTTVVIAHRLSTIKNADLIYVIKGGVIAEKGTHDMMINNGGLYASLVALHSKGHHG